MASKIGDLTNELLSSKLKITISIVLSLALIILGVFFGSKLSFSFFAPAKDSELIIVEVLSSMPYSIDKSVESVSIVKDKILKDFNNEIESISYIRGDEKATLFRINLTPVLDRDISARDIVNGINFYNAEFEEITLNASLISAGPPTTAYPFAMQIFADGEELSKASDSISSYVKGLKSESKYSVEEVRVEYLDTIAKKIVRDMPSLKLNSTDL